MFKDFLNFYINLFSAIGSDHHYFDCFQVLLRKIKALNDFPMAIPPPTPDKYLHNIVWLENKDVLIEFFKVKILSSILGHF